MKVEVFVSDQKIFASDEAGEIVYDTGLMRITKPPSEDDSEYGYEDVFVYAFRPGQYAKVATSDGVRTVRVNE